MKPLGFGLLLTGLVALIEWLAWGRAALVAGVTFGLLATAIQVTAVTALRPALSAPSSFAGRTRMSSPVGSSPSPALSGLSCCTSSSMCPDRR